MKLPPLPLELHTNIYATGESFEGMHRQSFHKFGELISIWNPSVWSSILMTNNCKQNNEIKKAGPINQTAISRQTYIRDI